MKNYTILLDEFGNKTIKAENELGQFFFIPSDPANSDYQAYLKSLEDEA
jgi:hypothetical protein